MAEELCYVIDEKVSSFSEAAETCATDYDGFLAPVNSSMFPELQSVGQLAHSDGHLKLERVFLGHHITLVALHMVACTLHCVFFSDEFV